MTIFVTILAAIRFFRSFIGVNDDFYNRHLTKLNLFEPIIEVFKANGSKYNLLNSAIIEIFEFIRRVSANFVCLLTPFVGKHQTVDSTCR